MKLSDLAKGTKLIVYEELHNRAISEEQEAVVKYHEGEKSVIVACHWLYDNYEKLSLGSLLNVTLDEGNKAHSFKAKATEKLRSGHQVLLDQITDIETVKRRKFDRDEMRVKVSVYGYPQAKITAGTIKLTTEQPEITDISHDISSGGLCLISSVLLSSKHDPYYLLEFNLRSKESFLLPAKLVRRSNYPHTKIGKYDYGFQFIFDNLPEEKGKLTASILSRKIHGR